MSHFVAYRVLYTKHISKKRKTYHDGFLKVQPNGQASLLGENGELLSSTKLPSKMLPLAVDEEDIDCMEGFLVNVDQACTEKDLPSKQDRAQRAAADQPLTQLKLPTGNCETEITTKQAFAAVKRLREFKAPARRQKPAEVPLPQVAASPKRSEKDWSGNRTCIQTRFPVDASKGAARDHQTASRSDSDILKLFSSAACGGSQPIIGHQALGWSSCSQQRSGQSPAETKAPVEVVRCMSHHPGHPQGSASPSELSFPATSRGSAQILQARPAAQQRIPVPGKAKVRWDAFGDIADAEAVQGKLDGVQAEEEELVFAMPDQLDMSSTEGEETRELVKEHQLASQDALAALPAGDGSDVETARKPLKQPRFEAPRRVKICEEQRESSADDASRKLLHFSAAAVTFPPPPAAAPTFRATVLPNTFSSEQQYVSQCAEAVVEELNLRVGEVARRFYSIAQGSVSASSPELAQLLRKGRVPYYHDCELSHYPAKPFGEKQESFFLTLNSGREPSNAFRLDDLWILSNSPAFGADKKHCQDRLRAPWTAVARSRWHGPNKDGRMQILFLGRPPPRLGRSQAVFAIHGPEAFTELAMLDEFAKLDGAKLPILAALATKAAGTAVGERPGAAPRTQVEAIAREFGLNSEQAAALQSTESWFSVAPKSKEYLGSPICVIHGPFGSGKSTLLVAMLSFFAAQTAEGRPVRVLVSANTNIAVDRVLLGLLDQGFTDLIRVGSVRRIHSRLLPHSLHSRQEKGSNNAAAELNAMLKDCSCPAEAHFLRQELAQLKAGAERKRKRLLGSVRVVGMTCCGTISPLLDSLAFDICVLDESSQIIEPLSLLALSRAKCRFLVAAGDPCQLPPVVCSPTGVQQAAAGPARFGIARPLFARLVAMGYPSHLLRRQYRCHPTLSAVPNRLFYAGQLLDGCTAAERQPVVAGVPELVCMNAAGECRSDASQSCSNRTEAVTVAKIIDRLVSAGVPQHSIGVICFFRSQVALIQAVLAAARGSKTKEEDGGSDLQPKIETATVDSFQGMEKDVIILSTTVTRCGAFSSDPQRLNVALTRARRHLIVVGDLAVLPLLAPAFGQLLEAAAALPGGICQNFASFIPHTLTSGKHGERRADEDER